MGWDRGRYYTRSRKVNGRVVREYIGTGPTAALAAQMDALDRDMRQTEAEGRKRLATDLATRDAAVDDFGARCDLLARAFLLAAGCRQHKRGEWRKRRGGRQEG